MPIFTMIIGVIGCVVAGILHKVAIAGIALCIGIALDIILIIIFILTDDKSGTVFVIDDDWVFKNKEDKYGNNKEEA